MWILSCVNDALHG